MTLHGFDTWRPDRPQGYWHHAKGLLSQDHDEAKRRKRSITQRSTLFTPEIQRFIIESGIAAAEHLAVTVSAFATSDSHVHPLLMWRDERADIVIRRELKQSLTLRLNRDFGKRTWFVRKGWCQRVRDEGHRAHLLDEYLPSHPGWYWSLRSGWRPPRIR